MHAVCQMCNTSFTVPPSRSQKARYCSPPCYQKSRMVPLAERFSRYVGDKTPSGCILWAGKRNKRGYGWIKADGAKTFIGAHRVAYQLAKGAIPPGMHILHSCDNPSCVNPDHLRIDTHAANVNDMVEKRRHRFGSRHYRTSLTENDVRDIRERAEAGEHRQRIASRYGITRGAVNDIIRRVNWKHVA